jgi:hypothetical protein
MKNNLQQIALTISSLILSIAIIDARPAEAVDFKFNGEVDSGALDGEKFQGSFSYDESLVTGTGDFFIPEYIEVSNFKLNFLDSTFTQADGIPEVAFDGNNLMGLSFNVNKATAGNIQLDFSFVPGLTDISESYFTYSPTTGTGATGSVTFTEQKIDVPQPVPEPTTILGTTLALGFGSLLKKKTGNRNN